MKNILEKIINTRSLIVLSLIITLDIAIIKGIRLNENLFLLFSNLLTMVMTYFFTKKKEDKDESSSKE
jgi:type III secretory pathway component EscV